MVGKQKLLSCDFCARRRVCLCVCSFALTFCLERVDNIFLSKRLVIEQPLGISSRLLSIEQRLIRRQFAGASDIATLTITLIIQ